MYDTPFCPHAEMNTGRYYLLKKTKNNNKNKNTTKGSADLDFGRTLFIKTRCITSRLTENVPVQHLYRLLLHGLLKSKAIPNVNINAKNTFRLGKIPLSLGSFHFI